MASQAENSGSIPERITRMTCDKTFKQEDAMQTVIVELRAAEGGDDAKLLVEDQLRIYGRVCTLKGY